MNDENGWEHIIDLLILLNADEELIKKIKDNEEYKEQTNEKEN